MFSSLHTLLTRKDSTLEERALAGPLLAETSGRTDPEEGASGAPCGGGVADLVGDGGLTAEGRSVTVT